MSSLSERLAAARLAAGRQEKIDAGIDPDQPLQPREIDPWEASPEDLPQIPEAAEAPVVEVNPRVTPEASPNDSLVDPIGVEPFDSETDNPIIDLPEPSVDTDGDFDPTEYSYERGEREPKAKDTLLKTHATRQFAREATAASIQGFANIRGAGQDIKSFFTTKSLERTRNKAQRQFERNARKAETSLFKGRREKFAARAATSKNELENATSAVLDNANMIDDRDQARVDARSGRENAVARSRELFAAKSKIAMERRSRRREKVAVLYRELGPLGDTQEVKDRRAALKSKPSMVEFRKAVLKSLYETQQ